MKTEVRCRECGRGHLLDVATATQGNETVLCQGCGAPLVLPARVRPAADPVGAIRGGGASEKGAPPDRKSPSTDENVVCPRCGLHFQPGAVHAPARSAERPTVLIVEDMAYFQEMAREALAPKYELKQAGTVAEAREVLATSRVDVILLDLVLSGGEDGLALLRGLPRKPCPVLLFTAQDESELYGARWEELRALGADDLVFKGINTGEILARKVDDLLASHGPVG